MTTREPIVRTLHGYAFALLRRAGGAVRRTAAAAARRRGSPTRWSASCWPANGRAVRGGWPESRRPALGSPAFAAELRDLMLRTAERGHRARPAGRIWAGAGGGPNGRPARGSRANTRTSPTCGREQSASAPALDQAELTRAALGLLTDDQVLADEQARVRRIFVDEYQDVDPAQARLIELLSSGADELVVVRRSRPVDLCLPWLCTRVRCGTSRSTTPFR